MIKPNTVSSVFIAFCVVLRLPNASGEEETSTANLSSEIAKEWVFGDPSWRARSGIIEQTDSSLHGTCAFWTTHVWSDFAYSAEFMPLPEGKGVKAAGLVFGSIDSENYYWAHYDSRNSQIILYVLEDGAFREITRKGGLPQPTEKWHSAKIERIGDAIKVYLNDKLEIEAKDETFRIGCLGLRAGQGHIQFRKLSVKGEPAELEKPWRVIPPKYQIICDDAGAGAYEAFPDITKLQNGDLLCVFYAGYGHVSIPTERWPKGGRVVAVRSADQGKTWSKPTIVVDTSLDDRDPSVVQLKNGTLMCNFFIRNQDAQRRIPAPGYERTNDVWIVRSFDNGLTWESEPTPIESPFTTYQACSEPILELTEGTLLLPTYGANKGRPHAVAFVRSRDGGKTWGDVTILQDDHTHYEPAIAQLTDGTLVCTLRPCMCITFSSDGGRTWKTTKKMGWRGDAPYLLLTAGGILLNAHRHPGTSVEYSLDNGQTWQKPALIDSAGGAYPSMVELDDGTILCVYYNDRGARGHGIRARRFTVDADGIEFLPVP